MYKYLRPAKIKRIEKSLLLLKIRRIEKSSLLLKIRRIEKSLLLLKIRRIEKSLRLLKIRQTIKSLRGIEIPAPGEKPTFVKKLAELEKQAACLLFRLGGISSCWLLPGLADEHVQILVDVMSLACILQVRRRLRLPCFYGRPFPVLYRLFVPAHHAKKWLKSTRQPKVRLPPGILLISVKSKNS